MLQPLALGAWFPRIPQVQESIGLSEGTLAIALMGMPLGLLVALSFGSKLAELLGTRGLLTFGLGGYLIAMPAPAFATSGPVLFGALSLAGVCMAIAQLSLNVTASEVEARSDSSIMNGCHGYWSIGVLLGSAIGAAMAEARVSPGAALSIVSAVSFIPLIFVARHITNYPLPAAPKLQARSGRPSRPLIYIALFGFGIATTEGAMADWLAVFMTNIFDASPGIAGASYTVFALSVALGRFQGDALKSRFAVEKLAQCLVVLALAGLLIALVSPTIWLSFAGVALLGFGVSLGFPLAVSAASVLKGRSSAANVAILTQLTLCGFLIGPPIIGLVAEFSNMRIGLAALIPALLLAFLFARALKSQPPS
ncbi:MFS transporter [Octadecabacter ascidiaceicola]|uniref:MFS transporter n=1 Tax=Octadecabacter ascidiaceicola TaxID=1655543 RepID=UPI0011802969|nr:MFS transporter [Octadecabacter ascidiaceicola]